MESDRIECGGDCSRILFLVEGLSTRKRDANHCDLCYFYAADLCWLLVASVGPNWPVRTSHAVSCSLPIPQRKYILSSIGSLIFSKGEWTLCKGYSPSSRG